MLWGQLGPLITDSRVEELDQMRQRGLKKLTIEFALRCP